MSWADTSEQGAGFPPGTPAHWVPWCLGSVRQNVLGSVRQNVLGSKVDSSSQGESLPLQTALETRCPAHGDNTLPRVKGGGHLSTVRHTAPCPVR